MTLARIKYPDILKGKSKKEMLDLLNTIYNDNLREIAIAYYIKEECQIDIAFKYNIDVRTVRNYLNRIKKQLEQD